MRLYYLASICDRRGKHFVTLTETDILQLWSNIYMPQEILLLGSISNISDTNIYQNIDITYLRWCLGNSLKGTCECYEPWWIDAFIVANAIYRYNDFILWLLYIMDLFASKLLYIACCFTYNKLLKYNMMPMLSKWNHNNDKYLNLALPNCWHGYCNSREWAW